MLLVDAAERDGYVVSADYGARVLVLCPGCAAGQARAQAWSRLPDEAHGVQFDTLALYPHQRPVLAAVARLLRERCGWLTLVGGYGTGKTTLIYAALNHLAERGIYGRYETAPDLLTFLRDGLQDTAGMSPSARLRLLSDAPALAIDELDKYSATAFADEAIFRLFNARYQARRRQITILGFNHDGEDRVPPFLLSRARDGRFQYLALSGPDLRPSLRSLDPWDRGEGER